MIHQLYHVGQHGDADNSFAPELVAVGPALVPRRRWQPRDDRGRDRGADRRASSRRPAGPRRAASTASSCSPPTTRSSTSSGRRGRTAGRTRGAARSRTGCASRPRSSAGSASAAATTSSSGWRSASTRVPRRRCRSTSWQEIVAWHDERRLMDYVTCGTGSYFDFYQIIPTSLYDAAARRAVRRRAQGASSGTRVVQAESHIRTPGRGRGRAGRRPCRHGHHRPRPDRRPAPGRQGPRRPRRTRSGRASRATSCAGAAARATTGSRAWSTRRPGASSSGAATGSSRPAATRRCSSSVAGRPGSRRRASRPSAATA